ncbi:serine/threonine-protein kinase [Nocardioides nitrophenolicus]|uniref:serine/threonine-protein kinase n=1 Tax=Nocardioides nitrophenolicus TaxID=60489 RepID=UPI0019585D5B|nr:serine/threonine-protein kinase [Nocardioides nitrophenolicus]MBM7516672.1 serine/threonine protein kinase [Nocardioides nitrophenolicus]
MALQPGDSFGRYDVTGHLGRGGMGVVLAAVHRDLDRPVALKVLAPHLADDAGYRARFLREAKALARLDSPYVVRVFDAGEEEGALFIATELVRDGDLNQLLRSRGPLPAEDAVALVRDLAVGLGAAHDVGILHRDIKPSNVLIAPRPDGGLRPVLCDFGIAAVADLDQLATTGAVGTPGYMAPERHQGSEASVASDIYALGCLLWAALTARAPYEGVTGQVLLGHLQGPVPQLPSATREARAINEVLAVAMAKDPAARFGTTAELVAALDAVPLGPVEHTLLAPPPPPLPSGSGSRSRRPLLAGVAALALVLVAAGLGWLLTRSDPAADADPPADASSGPSTVDVGGDPTPDPLLAAFPRAADCAVVPDPKSTRVRARWCLGATSSVYYAQWRGWEGMDANYRDRAVRQHSYRSDLDAAWVELADVDRGYCRRKLALWYADRAAPYSVTVCADSDQAVLDALEALDLPTGEQVVARVAAEPDALVAAFPTAAGCSPRVPKATRVRTRWCHDDDSSVHYTQWEDAAVMDANYRGQVVTPVTGVGDGLDAAWVELTKAEGEEWETKLALWYDDERAPYSVTIYADTQAAARRVLRDLDLRPVEDVAAIPRD